MPAEAPGRRVVRVATKEVRHGDPTVEKGAPGIAFKTQEETPVLPSYASARAAKVIAVNEEFVVGIAGRHPVRTELLPGGIKAGEPIYIETANNKLVAAPGAGIVKFGVLEQEPEEAMDWAQVNLDLRNSF